jgi:hypothetical protein
VDRTLPRVAKEPSKLCGGGRWGSIPAHDIISQQSHIETMANIPSISNKPANLPSSNSTNSFWHRSPSPFLLHHRTTPELPLFADVVIVGSGATGAFCARYLAESAGLSVVMVEAREACWGATGRVCLKKKKNSFPRHIFSYM